MLLVLVAVAHLMPEPLQLGLGLLPVLGSQLEQSPRNLTLGHAEMTPVLVRGHGGDAPSFGWFFHQSLPFLPPQGLLLGGSGGTRRKAAGPFASAPAAEADPERSQMHAKPHNPTPKAARL